MRPSVAARLALLGMVVAASALAACDLPSLQRASQEVAAGDCFARAEGDELVSAGCDEPTAKLVVLRVMESGDPAACNTVAGAHTSATVADRVLCLGSVGADPARDANAAAVGDCLAGDGEEFERTPCSAPDANYEVLQRLTDVALADEAAACLDVPGTTVSYSWSWMAADEVNVDPSTIDVVLCLAEWGSSS